MWEDGSIGSRSTCPELFEFFRTRSGFDEPRAGCLLSGHCFPLGVLWGCFTKSCGVSAEFESVL